MVRVRDARQYRYVLRTLLMRRDDYLVHLETTQGHDQSRLSQTDMALFASLPEQFWMVEFSLPALYTGNRSKLGEVLISSQGTPDRPALVQALRVPSLILVREGEGLRPFDCDLKAHSPIFRPADHDNEW